MVSATIQTDWAEISIISIMALSSELAKLLILSENRSYLLERVYWKFRNNVVFTPKTGVQEFMESIIMYLMI